MSARGTSISIGFKEGETEKAVYEGLLFCLPPKKGWNKYANRFAGEARDMLNLAVEAIKKNAPEVQYFSYKVFRSEEGLYTIHVLCPINNMWVLLSKKTPEIIEKMFADFYAGAVQGYKENDIH